MKILFLKSRTKGHTRVLPSGRVVLVSAYDKKDIVNHDQMEIGFNYRGRKEVPGRFRQTASKLWSEGCTAQYIAAHIGITAQTVIGWLREDGHDVSNRRYYDQDVLSKINGLRKEKMSYAKIAEALGISESAIERYVKKSGIAKYKLASADEKSEAVKRYIDGHSPSEIGEQLGYSTNAVANWVGEAGAMRTLSESRALSASKLAPTNNDRYSKKGAFHSSKSGKWFYSASSYEYVRMKQLDDDANVASWSRCLDRISYMDGDQPRYYVPDLDVTMADGTRVIEEIKPAFKRNDPGVLAKEAAATDYYQKIGAKYRVITQNEIGTDYIKEFDWSGFSAFSQDEAKQIRKEKVRQNSRDRRAALRNTSEIKNDGETLKKSLSVVLFFE